MTSDHDQREFVRALFQRVLRRPATDVEVHHWAAVVDHHGHAAALGYVFDSGEYLFQNRVDMQSEFRPGHFYSPVVDPEALRAAGFTVDRDLHEARLDGIDLQPAARGDGSVLPQARAADERLRVRAAAFAAGALPRAQ